MTSLYFWGNFYHLLWFGIRLENEIKRTHNQMKNAIYEVSPSIFFIYYVIALHFRIENFIIMQLK